MAKQPTFAPPKMNAIKRYICKKKKKRIHDVFVKCRGRSRIVIDPSALPFIKKRINPT